MQLEIVFIVLLLLLLRQGESIFSMITNNQTHLVNLGQVLELDCQFYSEHYELFDYPVLWKKTQNGEETQLNIMGNINEPFLKENRFEVTFTSAPSRFNLQLSISDVVLEDSGNYTCEIRGPSSVVLRQVIHYIYVKAEIKSVTLVSGDSSYSARFVNNTSHQTFHFVENRPSILKCVALGGFPPPNLQIELGGSDLSPDFAFSLRTETTGIMGMRLMTHRTELVNYNFSPSAEDDGKILRCVGITSGFRPFVALVRMDVDFSPQISCHRAEAHLGQVDAVIECHVRAKPRASAVFWIIDDNGTRLGEGEITDRYEALTVDVDKRTAKSQLRIRYVDAKAVRTYTIVAENRVTISAKEVVLHQRDHLDFRDGDFEGLDEPNSPGSGSQDVWYGVPQQERNQLNLEYNGCMQLESRETFTCLFVCFCALTNYYRN